MDLRISSFWVKFESFEKNLPSFFGFQPSLKKLLVDFRNEGFAKFEDKKKCLVSCVISLTKDVLPGKPQRRSVHFPLPNNFRHNLIFHYI